MVLLLIERDIASKLKLNVVASDSTKIGFKPAANLFQTANDPLALIRELHALGLDFSIKKFNNGFENTVDLKEQERDIFKDLETRLKLRALLARKKAEQFAKANEASKKEA